MTHTNQQSKTLAYSLQWPLSAVSYVVVLYGFFYLVLAATGLPVFTFNPISLHDIGTMLTVAGWIQVAS